MSEGLGLSFWIARVKSAIRMSFFASLAASGAWFVSFIAMCSLALSIGEAGKDFDQDFFLVIVNVIPLLLITNAVSFLTQVASSSSVVFDSIMVLFFMVSVVGFLGLFYSQVEHPTRLDHLYFFGALLPGIATILTYWLFFKLAPKRMSSVGVGGKRLQRDR